MRSVCLASTVSSRFTIVVLLVSLGAARGAAQDLDALLQRSASPGSLGLMLRYRSDPRVGEAWRAGLSSQDPRVRGAAARLLHVAGEASAVPELKAALVKEADAGAALEEVRALLDLGGPPIDDSAIGAASRFPAGPIVEAVVDARGADVWPLVASLRPLIQAEADVSTLVSAAVDRTPGRLNLLAQSALQAGDAVLWCAVLDVADDEAIAVSSETLMAGLGSSTQEIRAAAWWFVAVLGAGERALPEGLHALADAAAPGGGDQDLARQLVSRALGNPARANVAAVEHVYAPSANLPLFAARRRARPLARLLTDLERTAAEGVRGVSLPARDAREEPPPFPTAPTGSYGPFHTLRTPGPLPAGYAAEVFLVSGCVLPADGAVGGVSALYGDAHRLERTSTFAMPSLPACERAAEAIGLAGLLPAKRSTRSGMTDVVLVPLHPDFIGCVSLPHPVAERVQVGGRLRPPRKVKDRRPQYPPEAMEHHDEGTVVWRAIVGTTGCVKEAEIIRGISTGRDLTTSRMLDLAAGYAISGWAFEPSTLDGAPIEVSMIVTVQFALK